MQEDIKTGDVLLAEDVNYIVSAGKEAYRGHRLRDARFEDVYLVYPSAALPRFIVPLKDKVAQKFVLRMMSAGKGIVGAFLRMILRMPGGTALLRAVIFRERIIVDNHD